MKEYGIDYELEVSYDDDGLDIMNSVNKALFDAGIGFQFVLEEENQNDDHPSLFYSMLRTDELVKE